MLFHATTISGLFALHRAKFRRSFPLAFCVVVHNKISVAMFAFVPMNMMLVGVCHIRIIVITIILSHTLRRAEIMI